MMTIVTRFSMFIAILNVGRGMLWELGATVVKFHLAFFFHKTSYLAS